MAAWADSGEPRRLRRQRKDKTVLLGQIMVKEASILVSLKDDAGKIIGFQEFSLDELMHDTHYAARFGQVTVIAIIESDEKWQQRSIEPGLEIDPAEE